VFFELCREGDIVLCMSDGVHDNFDPKSLGYEPSDFGLQVCSAVVPVLQKDGSAIIPTVTTSSFFFFFF
jgi:hypothetical protein